MRAAPCIMLVTASPGQPAWPDQHSGTVTDQQGCKFAPVRLLLMRRCVLIKQVEVAVVTQTVLVLHDNCTSAAALAAALNAAALDASLQAGILGRPIAVCSM